MSKCCGSKEKKLESKDTCKSAKGEKHKETCSSKQGRNGPFAHFKNMIQNCLNYANESKSKGKKIVGIMCEYTPRELIMAAGGIPVCLCGGSVKTIPAAEEHLPSNLCPLIKSTYGYLVKKSNPFLNMADLVVAETTCDGKKKMYELMAESVPMYVLELPQKEDNKDSYNHWLIELRKFKSELENRLGVKITNEKIRDAIKIMNRERALRRNLASFMKLDSPPLTGRELLNFKSSISGICEDFRQYEKAQKILEDEKNKQKQSSKVRVLMTGVPMVYGAEKVIDIVESNGGLVVCMENCTGLKPIFEDVDEDAEDPIEALAKRYFRIPCALMTKNERRLEWLRTMAKEYRPQCIIELIWQACLTYDVEAYKIKRFAEKELKVPYLRIETDYSPSDSAQITVRVEALFETVRGKTKKKS